MLFEVTNQIRVPDLLEGQQWYEKLLGKKPDFIPHEGFVEWEVIPGFWLQLAEGTPSKNSGPFRIGVTDLEATRDLLVQELNIARFEIHSREEVPVKWGTFEDPWGNGVGFYEYHDKKEEEERLNLLYK